MPNEFDVDRLYAARTPAELTAEYDRVAEGYDSALIEQHDWRMPEIMAGICAWLLPRSAQILDAACGTGLVGDGLARLGFDSVYGLDLSPGMLAVAGRKGVYRGLAHVALGATLPYATGQFDAFIVSGAFTPRHAPPESFGELLRITRPGGLALFSLRTDDPPAGFAEAIAHLTGVGRWRLLHEGVEFQSLPRAEPHVKNRIYAYTLAG